MKYGILLFGFCFACATSTPSKTSATKESSLGSKPQKAELSDEDVGRVREYMWALAGQVRGLDEELTFDQNTDADRFAVKQRLEKILEIVDDLDEDNHSIGHPVIADGLGRFRAEVVFALDTQQSEKGVLLNAGKVIGSCATCHDIHACPFDSYARCVDTSR